MASQPFSQDFVQLDRLVKRRYVQVPRKHQQLLDRADAWSENPKLGARGDVPPQVLQHIKEFHTRKASRSAQQKTSTQQGRRQQAPPSSSQDSGHDDAGDDAPVCSWPNTPAEEDNVVDEQPVEPGAHTLARKRRGSSPANMPLKKANPPFVLQDIPPSSAANSEGLEIEPPGFLSQTFESAVNRDARTLALVSARPEPTPPSAQLPLGTDANHAPPPRPAKRRRVQETIRPSKPLDQTAKPLSTITDNNQKSSTANVWTPSFASQPAPEKASQPTHPKIRSDSAKYGLSSIFTPTWEGRQADMVARGQFSVDLSSSTPQRHHLASTCSQQQLRSAVEVPAPIADGRPPLAAPQGSAARTPYELYKASYPDYPETSRKFISACMNLEALKRDNALSEYLYDDFVRAFSTDFLLYVAECSRRNCIKNRRKKPDIILPAVKWYHRTVRAPIYTKRIINWDNLADVLETHADDVRAVRRTSEDSQSDASESGDEESDDEFSDSSDERDEQAVDFHDEGEACTAIDAGEKMAVRASPELHIDSSEAQTVEDVEAAPKPMQGKVPARLDEAAAFLGASGPPNRNENTGDAPEREHRQDVNPDRDVEVVLESEAPICRSKRPQNSPGSVEVPATPVELEVYESPTPRELTPHNDDGVSFVAIDEQSMFVLERSPSLGIASVAGDLRHKDEQKHETCDTSPLEKIARPVSATEAQENPVVEDEDEDMESDDDDDAFDPPVTSTMPPPSRKRSNDARQSSPLLKARPASAKNPRTASSTKFVATKRGGEDMASIAGPERRTGEAQNRASRVTAGAASAGTAKRCGSVLSDKSYSSITLSNKRLAEAPEERSKKWKSFLKKRQSGSTVNHGSTPVTR